MASTARLVAEGRSQGRKVKASMPFMRVAAICWPESVIAETMITPLGKRARRCATMGASESKSPAEAPCSQMRGLPSGKARSR